MNKHQDILIIIPAYNEDANIGRVIDSIMRYSYSADILVIDDGSTDSTAITASEAGAMVLTLPFNMGYGAALQTGFMYAKRNKYHVVAQIDGDGQHEPECLLDMLTVAKNENMDMIIGSRFLGDHKYKLPLIRLIGIKLFSIIVFVITKQRITDPTSGFQVITQRLIDFYSSDYYPSDYPDADVLILAHRAGFCIKEVPVIMYGPKNQKSMHKGISQIYYIFKMFLSIFVTLLRKI
ncbi:glycosyltransferase family 2 protein [bacterium]|nr:glycosyltransferase family 2 protein [bacterium]MBU1753524.1 glycosyltransferase family 2 protein [bacterium]